MQWCKPLPVATLPRVRRRRSSGHSKIIEIIEIIEITEITELVARIEALEKNQNSK
jgi:hypothetical protein